MIDFIVSALEPIGNVISAVPVALFVFSSLVMVRFIFFSEKNRNQRKVILAFFLFLAILPVIFLFPWHREIQETEIFRTIAEFFYFFILGSFLPSFLIPGTVATIISLIIGFFLIYKRDKFIIISALSILPIEIVAVILIKYNIIKETMMYIMVFILNGILGMTFAVCLLILAGKNKSMKIIFSIIKTISIIFFILLLILFFIGFYNEKKTTGSPLIFHIKTIEFVDGTYKKNYGIKNFVETDSCFRFLFDSVKEMEETHIYIASNDDDFIFWRFNSGFDFVSLRPEIILKKAFFEKRIFPAKTTFKGDFDELNIDVLQSFIRDTSKEELDKEKLAHTYELYNKNGIKKVVIDYHEKGKWFEIEVL
ncbi:MAG: hypothetical protein LBQ87_08995 [Candidatus Fibromonas sp.]|jgi:hypothetical protein|nr:hypothetical protein [Candidatus Fibromonas sp.]